MVKRHDDIDFASGAYVFPGGKATEDDYRDEWDDLCDGAFEGETRTARIAAARETFEEAGILLARHRRNRGEGGSLIDDTLSRHLSPHRAPIDRGQESFLELIRANDLVLALDQMIHFGHWITPEMIPKRFDTHFYLVPAPANQTAEQDGRETTEAIWAHPQSILNREARSEATVIFPTRMNLGKLAEAQTAADAIKRFSAESVVTVLPQITKDEDGQPCLRIPEQAGYIQVTEPLKKVQKDVGPKTG